MGPGAPEGQRPAPGFLVLVALMLLGGCATGRVPTRLVDGAGRRSLAPSFPSESRAERLASAALASGGNGSAGGFPGQQADAFQEVQEACGLEKESRHPAGAALYLEQARQLLSQLARTRVTQRTFAPCRVFSWLLGEVLEDGERVDYAELSRRAERFWPLVLVRPDGYLVAALSGGPIQRMGPVKLDKGELKAGGLVVGAFYFSLGGVLYPVNEALRRVNTVPWAELGLERDWLNAALDGAQDAMGEMVLALGQSVLHPIRSAEELVQLPHTVALLIASSPEYFERFGAMSLQDQIREAARLSTHLLMLVGGGEGAVGTVGRAGGLGAELPVLALTAEGVLEMRTAVVAGGTLTTTLGVELGAFSLLHMAAKGRGGTGGASGKAGKTAPPKGPGKWIYKQPTTDSKDALDYQEQVTGQPAWRVYDIDNVEFDSFTGKELLEAKGPGYCSFFNPDGTPKYWYKNSGKFDEMMRQAEGQSKMAERVGLPLTWHVADANVAMFLRKIFHKEGWKNITVRHTRPAR